MPIPRRTIIPYLAPLLGLTLLVPVMLLSSAPSEPRGAPGSWLFPGEASPSSRAPERFWVLSRTTVIRRHRPAPRIQLVPRERALRFETARTLVRPPWSRPSWHSPGPVWSHSSPYDTMPPLGYRTRPTRSRERWVLLVPGPGDRI